MKRRHFVAALLAAKPVSELAPTFPPPIDRPQVSDQRWKYGVYELDVEYYRHSVRLIPKRVPVT